ncbi:hypothetical protein ABN034_32680 [Actinopolymorpha sp. B11F2]|uniref:AtpZ/AtpI family protein n=1 Tax=Actinopolymorpha sp. B11F2 TaxID=3160862 RepID=UPI0032E4070E
MSQNGSPPEPSGPAPSGAGHGAWGVFGYLVAGVGIYGGLGWLGDHYFRTSFLLPVGILVGLALALYLVFKRYGHHEPKDSP